MFLLLGMLHGCAPAADSFFAYDTFVATDEPGPDATARRGDDYPNTYSGAKAVYSGYSYAGTISSSSDQDWFGYNGTKSVTFKASGSYVSCTIYANTGTGSLGSSEGSCTGGGRTVTGGGGVVGHWVKITGSKATSYTLSVK